MDMKVGDMAMLRSGGPDMMVECVTSDGSVDCIWFDLDQQLHRENFDQTTLVVVNRAGD